MLYCFFRLCWNYPPRICSWRHYSKWSLLFGNNATSVCPHGRRVRKELFKTIIDFVAWQCARALWTASEAVSCFKVDMCDRISILLIRFSSSRLFSLPKGEVLKGERFSNILDIQAIWPTNWNMVQDFYHVFEYLYERFQHCVELEGDYFENLQWTILNKVSFW